MQESLNFKIHPDGNGDVSPGLTDLAAVAERAIAARRSLLTRECAGADFLGWIDLPVQAEEWVPELLDLSLELVERVDHLIVVGIGGSYLGARAIMEAFSTPGPYGGLIVLDQAGWEPVGPEIHFVGTHLAGHKIEQLLRRLGQRRFAVNVISKSGTTLETALAFRMLRNALEERYGDDANEYIIATTDPENGTLREMAKRRGWRCLPIPPDVGGRFSVLSPVGLLPLATAGLHIQALIEGAQRGRERFINLWSAETGRSAIEQMKENPALHYAALRRYLGEDGKAIEVLASFEPELTCIGDWWVQLFGESEGKDGKGLFPASAAYSGDLHSLGQYMQDGPRHLFETFISIERPTGKTKVPASSGDSDPADAFAGRPFNEINRAAELGTLRAHTNGGVPLLQIELLRLDEICLGELIYFFEAACAISALMLGVNPFDQPGVEAYKSEMRDQLNQG